MPNLRERVNAFLRPTERDTFSSLSYDYATIGRRALLPEWYFQAPYGQPRKINVDEIRELAKTPFIQLCTTTIIEDFATTPWLIVPKDKNAFNQTHIDELTFFLNNPNLNKETLPDLQRQWARDLLELDAGVFVKVFDEKSYVESEFTTAEHKYYQSGEKEGISKGSIQVKKMMKTLKEKGKRALKEIYVRDGSTFLKDGDYTGFVHRYYQYAFKLPRRDPQIFDRDEIVYSLKCPRSYSFYGWSPIQSLEDLVRALKEQIIYHLAFATEKGVPDGILSIMDISQIELNRLREYWKKEIKGKAHKFAVIGREAKFTSTMVTSRDMEMLSSQQWFMKIVMACFNLNVPILSLIGEAPKAGTWALQQRERHKAILPLLQLFENEMNTEILSEFGYEDVEFKFQTYDLEEDKMKRDMQIADLNAGMTTINEVRTEERGKDPVAWGEEPFSLGIHAMETASLPMTRMLKSFKKNKPSLDSFKKIITKMNSFDEFKKLTEVS
jgi:phage portal protein BeeE